MSFSVSNTNVTDSAVEDLLFKLNTVGGFSTITPDSNATATGAATGANALSVNDWHQAVTSPHGLGVVGAATGTVRYLGILNDVSDTATGAKYIQDLFGLSPTGPAVAAKFVSLTPGASISLANGAGTSANLSLVSTTYAGAAGSSSNTATLFDGSDVGGSTSIVRISATNTTAGSEAVQFQVSHI